MQNSLHNGIRLTYRIGSIAAIGGFLFGYHTGFISTLVIMPSFNQTFLINNYAEPELPTSIIDASIVASLSFGCIIGALLAGPLSDRFSRKYAILCSSIIFMLGIIVQTTAVHLSMLFIGRVITGTSIGALSTVVPVYQGEIVSGTRRGRIVSLHQVAVTLGITSGFWINYAIIDHLKGDIQWRLSFGIQLFPALILCIGIYFCPFSPHWLISQHRTDEARLVFQQIRDGDVSQNDEELESIQAEFSLEQGTAKKSYIRLITGLLRRRLILAIGIQLMSQLSGINSIMYYAPKIFNGISPNSEKTIHMIITGISGIVNVLATIPTFLFIDRLGRRILLMGGAIIMALSMITTGALFGSFGKVISNGTMTGVDVAIDNGSVPAYIIILGIYIFVAAFAATWGPISWLYPTEIFPLSLRAKATSISAASNWLSNCALAFLVPLLLNNLWFETYIIFGVLCIMMAMVIYLFFPETKGINSENIDEIFDRSICIRSVRLWNPYRINMSD